MLLSAGWVAVAVGQVGLSAVIIRFQATLDGFERVSQDEEALISRKEGTSASDMELKELKEEHSSAHIPQNTESRAAIGVVQDAAPTEEESTGKAQQAESTAMIERI